MARVNRIRIETDSQIARALLRNNTETRRHLQARANLVRAFYLREYDKSNPARASSPFEQKDGVSIKDKGTFSTKIIGGEIIIEMNAPAAEFAEVGNAPGPSGQKMRIRVKDSRVRHGKSKRGKPKLTLSSGTKVTQYRGKYYIFTDKAESFGGYHLLRKATHLAFRSLGR